MAERKAVAKEMTVRYAKAGKVEKGRMLDELCALTGWTRDHARRALRGARARPRPPRPRKPRRPVYSTEVIQALDRVWRIFGFLSGKRMAPFMAEAVQALQRCGELEVDDAVKRQLLTMSAATIDRRLAPVRKRLRLKGRQGTKPGTLLRQQIAIRTFADWDEARPGFCECDLVAHDGGSGVGIFAQTLVLTCVYTGWTEMRAVPNKAQRWCFAALKDMRQTLPFPLLGIDSDNGSEFINHELQLWCATEQITFTRTRPYRKNDNCFVEQKNWNVVRQAVGYHRYDTPAELKVLAELYGHLRLFQNFFQPSMKLVEKTRRGARVTRRYDTPLTPYRRALASPDVDRSVKKALTEQYLALNPVMLQKEITRLQTRLVTIVARKRKRKEVGSSPDHPWRRPNSRAFSVRQRKALSRT